MKKLKRVLNRTIAAVFVVSMVLSEFPMVTYADEYSTLVTADATDLEDAEQNGENSGEASGDEISAEENASVSETEGESEGNPDKEENSNAEGDADENSEKENPDSVSEADESTSLLPGTGEADSEMEEKNYVASHSILRSPVGVVGGEEKCNHSFWPSEYADNFDTIYENDPGFRMRVEEFVQEAVANGGTYDRRYGVPNHGVRYSKHTVTCPNCSETVTVFCVDSDNDQTCDLCGAQCCLHQGNFHYSPGPTKETHEKICEDCGYDFDQETENCADVDGDGSCDKCGQTITCSHEGQNHIPYGSNIDRRTSTNVKHYTECSSCKKNLGDDACVDEDGDEQCDVCSGDMPCTHKEENLSYTTGEVKNTHSVLCNRCNTYTVKNEACADADGDGNCDKCGNEVVICKHTSLKYVKSGTNACTHDEVCADCGEMVRKFVVCKDPDDDGVCDDCKSVMPVYKAGDTCPRCNNGTLAWTGSLGTSESETGHHTLVCTGSSVACDFKTYDSCCTFTESQKAYKGNWKHMVKCDVCSNTYTVSCTDTIVCEPLSASSSYVTKKHIFRCTECNGHGGGALNDPAVENVSDSFITNGWVQTEDHDPVVKSNKDGTHTYTCDECGLSLTRDCKNADGKKVTDSGAFVDNGDGTHTFTCADCGYTVTEDHNIKYSTVYPADEADYFHYVNSNGEAKSTKFAWGSSGLEKATHSRYCTKCAYKESEKCTFGTWSEYGSSRYEYQTYHFTKCSVCSNKVCEEHTYPNKGKSVDEDNHKYVCTKCGETGAYSKKTESHSFETETIYAELPADVNGTTADEYGNDAPFSTSKTFKKGEYHNIKTATTCENCDYENVEVKYQKHSFVEKDVAGKTVEICSDCGYQKEQEQEIVYKITLDLQGGTAPDRNYYDHYLVYPEKEGTLTLEGGTYEKRDLYYCDNGDIEIMMDIPTKDGYKFGGFFSEAEGNGKPMVDENGSFVYDARYYFEDTTIYAYWKKEAKITVRGNIMWDDAYNQDGIRPTGNIKISLFADGEDTGEVAYASEANSYRFGFSDRPKYSKDGNPIKYSFYYKAVNGYTDECRIMYEDEESIEFTIDFVHEPEKNGYEYHIGFKDSNDQDGLRPKTVTVKLYEDGSPMLSREETVLASEIGSVTIAVNDLPAYKNGYKINYTFEIEGIPDSYVLSQTDEYTGSKITRSLLYTYDPETLYIQGGITWDDFGNFDGIRPESMSVSILADDQTVQTITMDDSSDWKWKSKDLPRYRDHGTEIEYKYTASYVTGYEFTVYPATNKTVYKHTPKITVKWFDGLTDPVKEEVYDYGSNIDSSYVASFNPDPQRKKYTFTEWHFELSDGRIFGAPWFPNGKAEMVSDSFAMAEIFNTALKESKTICYRAAYDIEDVPYRIVWYDSDGFTELDKVESSFDEVNAYRPLTPTKEHKVFAGWERTSKSMYEEYQAWEANGSDMNSPITVSYQAKYSEAKYKVTFKNADGTVLNEQEVEVGQLPLAPANPTLVKEGYKITFKGWDPEIAPVTKDAVYVATYSEEKIVKPSVAPSTSPSVSPSASPTNTPDPTPSEEPSSEPTPDPSGEPVVTPTPSAEPSATPTAEPTSEPTQEPQNSPDPTPNEEDSDPEENVVPEPSTEPEETVKPTSTPSASPLVKVDDSNKDGTKERSSVPKTVVASLVAGGILLGVAGATGGLNYLWMMLFCWLFRKKRIKFHGVLSDEKLRFVSVDTRGDRAETVQEIANESESAADMIESILGSGNITYVPANTKMTVTYEDGNGELVVRTIAADENEMLRTVEQLDGSPVDVSIYNSKCGWEINLHFDFSK